MWKALLMAAFGLFLGSIGLDNMTASARFTMDIVELSDGVGMVPAVMGLFGIAEVLLNVEQSIKRSVFEAKIHHLLPTLRDWKDSIWAIFRGTFIGFFLGVLPGGGPSSPPSSPTPWRRRSPGAPRSSAAASSKAWPARRPQTMQPPGGIHPPADAGDSGQLGDGHPARGDDGPRHAAGADACPGATRPFLGAVTSMYIGNVMLLILNLPLIGLWVRILKVPYPILFPLILLFCLIGAYSLNNSVIEVLIMVGFGLLGYFFKKFEYEAAPLILALVLGPMLEAALRRSLLLSAEAP